MKILIKAIWHFRFFFFKKCYQMFNHSKLHVTNFRRKICFGINEVIKGLEKDQMRLVLACHSCKPEMLTQHMIGLAATRNCPATIISNLSTTLCPILKISSLMALGIKVRWIFPRISLTTVISSKLENLKQLTCTVDLTRRSQVQIH